MRFLPLHDMPPTHGPAVEKAIRDFYNTGRSVHSPDGVVLASLLNHLRDAKIPFTLRFVPGGGYFVERGADLITQPRTVIHAQDHREEAPKADRAHDGSEDSPGPAAESRAPGGDPARAVLHARGWPALSHIDVIAAHIDATKGTSLASEYVRITLDQWERLKPYAHREGDHHTLLGLPVEVIHTPEDEARQANGQRGFVIPAEAIASKE